MKTDINVACSGLGFPEGPAFDPDGNLWCVELHSGHLTRVLQNDCERIPTDGAPNGLAFDAEGRALVCDAQRNEIIARSAGTWDVVVNGADGRMLTKPNDLAFDALGNLAFTCPGDSTERPTGFVCCLSRAGEPTVIADELYFPNGLAFVSEGTELVVAETFRQRLWKGAWDTDACKWIDPRPWADVGGKTGPDGMALGADGLLYVAIFGSGVIKAVNPDGEIEAEYELPGSQPTNAAFDPSGELGLVVTEAERGELLSLPDLGPGAKLYYGGGR